MRSVDVLRIENGGLTGKKVTAPVRNEWFGSPTLDSTSFQTSGTFRFMCPLLKPALATR